jgi:putative peptidoglycan lipid II flippase
MGPTLFGGSVSQLNILLNTILASNLVAGSVTWLYYADRLVELPFGVFSVALGTVLLPRLAARHAQAEQRDFARTLDWGLRSALLIIVPAAAGLALLAQPVLCTLFQYGAMTGEDVRMAGMALAAYAFGLIGMSLVKILTTASFARQDTRSPVRAGIAAVAVNVVLSLSLVGTFEHVGLAAATALAAFVNAALVYRALVVTGAYQAGAGWLQFLTRIAVATAAMSVAVWLLNPRLSVWLEWGVVDRATRCMGLIAIGAGIYLAMLWALGMRWRSLRTQATDE